MNELSDRLITEIQNAVQTAIMFDKQGNEYSTRPLYPVLPISFPEPERLDIATLTGLVDFILAHKDGNMSPAPAIVHVKDHRVVEVLSDIYGPSKQRTCFVQASFEELLGKSFVFGQFYEKEAFIVGLQSLFEPTPQRADILKLIGTIKDNQVREFADDGVTQSVSAKAGVALVSEIAVPNPVILKPYRTFRELDQPESPFIIRVHTGKEMPACALFEADGGRWKLSAIQRIKEYLEDKIGLPIFA
ncbi:MAG: hypothetical protein JXA73_08955 [Acidobacteria bacterium]|nr:hypothetical protein [Acidobacteriota bacterium]